MRTQVLLISVVAVAFFVVASTARAENSIAEERLFQVLSMTVQEDLSEKIASNLAAAVAKPIGSSDIEELPLSSGLAAVVER